MLRLLALIFALLAGPAFAAVTANSIITAQTPNRGKLQLSNGTLTGTVYTAGANGSKCFGMWAGSTDTSAQLLSITLVNTAISYYGTEIGRAHV